MATKIDVVSLAKDVKDFIVNTDVGYKTPLLKKKIFDSDDNSFLRIVKTIGSNTTIVDVTLVDDDFISRAVLGY